MSQSGKGVSDIMNIFGGVGRLVYANSDVAYPDALADILTPSTGVLASGWNDFGATDGGLRIITGFEKQEWEVDQENSPIDEFITRWNWRFETKLVEISLENLKIAWEGSDITTNSSPTPDERTVKFGAPSTVTERMMAYIQDKREEDGTGYIRAYIFRKARYGGADSSHDFVKGEKAGLPVTFTLLPDTELADNESVLYAIDQVPA